MQGLVNGPGCSVDGTKAANPLGRVVDQFLGMGGSNANGRMVGPPAAVAGTPAGLRAGMQAQASARRCGAAAWPVSVPRGAAGAMNDVDGATARWSCRRAAGGAGSAAAMNASFQAAQAQQPTRHGHPLSNRLEAEGH